MRKTIAGIILVLAACGVRAADFGGLAVRAEELKGQAFAEISLAPLEKGPGLSGDAYLDVLHFRAYNGNYIDDTQARAVAKYAAEKRLDVETFKKVYYRSGDYPSAIEVSCGDMDGTHSAAVYLDVLYYRSYNGNYIEDTRARAVAKYAAEKRLDVETFKKVYYRTGDYASAMEVAALP